MAIEIKSSKAAKPSAGYFKALKEVSPATAYLVAQVPESFDVETHSVMTLRDMIKVVRTVLH